MKNPHVEMKPSRDRDFYYFDYTFKDHLDISRHFEFQFPLEYTNQRIARFGIPESLIEPFAPTEQAINERRKIAWEGLFFINGNTIEIDKSAVVSFYAKDYGKPIAYFIKKCLKEQGVDNRLQRIEMAMKFVQDIPYGIPNWEKNGKYYGGISTPPEILIYGYGDCDSKAFLFACILSYLIDPGDLIFVQHDQHLMTAIKNKSVEGMCYIPINNENYAIAETSGPARYNFGELDEETEPKILAEKLEFQKDINRLSSRPTKNIKKRLSSRIIIQKKDYYKILFRNEYKDDIALLVHYYSIDGEWTTDGWYKIKPGNTIHIASSKDKTFYYYAHCNSGVWSGNFNIDYKGETYKFNKIKNPQKGFADLLYVLSGDE